MRPESENPAVRADGGAYQDVVAGWRDTSDRTRSLESLQAAVVADRYHVPWRVARVIAEHAFAAGGAR